MSYSNPILPGFNPDPSIVRVGNDYYMVTSTFAYFPAIPVYHSTDLINWRQIGNAVSRPDQLPYEKAPSFGGVWAPTIRYHQGVFYVTAPFHGVGNFIVHTADPAGEWSDVIWTEADQGIDPSMYFEGDEMYYCVNGGSKRRQQGEPDGIWLCRMDPQTGKMLGPQQRIWSGTGGGYLESPHLYLIDGWYYIMAAEGGTGFNHMTTIGRSRHIWGPYENNPGNPILTNRADSSKQIACSGHSDLVQDPLGNWWMVHLAVRPSNNLLYHLGRESFLMPVVWNDGWPQVGKSLLSVETPLITAGQPRWSFQTDFSHGSAEYPWLFLRHPQAEHYEFRDHSLLLHVSETTLQSESGSPTMMLLRPVDLECTFRATVEPQLQAEGDYTGITAYLTDKFYYQAGIRRTIASGKPQDVLVLEAHLDSLHHICCQIPCSETRLTLVLCASAQKMRFEAILPSGETFLLGELPTRFLSIDLAGRCFTGTLFGLFAETTAPGSAGAMSVTEVSLS
ncbi:MAG: family 43 glycosylhydrolase [Firmicutes bacterium]|nr:family 43 glycosylhydrolase [Bacillota bacterium]